MHASPLQLGKKKFIRKDVFNKYKSQNYSRKSTKNFIQKNKTQKYKAKRNRTAKTKTKKKKKKRKEEN